MVNRSLAQKLQSSIESLKEAIDGRTASDIIEENAPDIAMGYLTEIKTMLNSKEYEALLQQIAGIDRFNYPEMDSRIQFELQASPTKTAQYRDIFQKIMNLEYEAREKNKALLLRGSQLISFKPSTQKALPTKFLAGSTIPIKSGAETMEKTYHKGEKLLYSISFGNSLFAGIRDATANVFYYLAQQPWSKSDVKFDYALLINKAD